MFTSKNEFKKLYFFNNRTGKYCLYFLCVEFRSIFITYNIDIRVIPKLTLNEIKILTFKFFLVNIVAVIQKKCIN